MQRTATKTKRKRRRGGKPAAGTNTNETAANEPVVKLEPQVQSALSSRGSLPSAYRIIEGEPPRVGLSKIFLDGIFPEGELCEYKDEYDIRIFCCPTN